MSATVTISAKGRIKLKKSMLAHLGVAPGGKLRLVLCPGGVELRAAPTGKISDAFGVLKRRDQRAMTIEEMNEVIADGWAGKL